MQMKTSKYPDIMYQRKENVVMLTATRIEDQINNGMSKMENQE